NVFVREAAKKREDEQLARQRLESRERGSQGIAALRRFAVVAGFVAGRVAACQPGLEIRVNTVVALAPHTVDCPRARERPKPGAPAAARAIEAKSLAPDLPVDVLGHLLSALRVAGDQEGDAVYAGERRVVQRSQRALVLTPDRADQTA